MKKQFVKPECKVMKMNFESLLHETSVYYGGKGDGVGEAKNQGFFEDDFDDEDDF